MGFILAFLFNLFFLQPSANAYTYLDLPEPSKIIEECQKNNPNIGNFIGCVSGHLDICVSGLYQFEHPLTFTSAVRDTFTRDFFYQAEKVLKEMPELTLVLSTQAVDEVEQHGINRTLEDLSQTVAKLIDLLNSKLSSRKMYNEDSETILYYAKEVSRLATKIEKGNYSPKLKEVCSALRMKWEFLLLQKYKLAILFLYGSEEEQKQEKRRVVISLAKQIVDLLRLTEKNIALRESKTRWIYRATFDWPWLKAFVIGSEGRPSALAFSNLVLVMTFYKILQENSPLSSTIFAGLLVFFATSVAIESDDAVKKAISYEHEVLIKIKEGEYLKNLIQEVILSKLFPVTVLNKFLEEVPSLNQLERVLYQHCERIAAGATP